MSAPTAGGRRSFLTGLLGQGVGPSLSPELHEREGHRHGLRYVYKLVELDGETVRPEYLRGLLGAAVHLGFDGLNVTHPVKQVMVELLPDERRILIQTEFQLKAFGEVVRQVLSAIQILWRPLPDNSLNYHVRPSIRESRTTAKFTDLGNVDCALPTRVAIRVPKNSTREHAA